MKSSRITCDVAGRVEGGRLGIDARSDAGEELGEGIHADTAPITSSIFPAPLIDSHRSSVRDCTFGETSGDVECARNANNARGRSFLPRRRSSIIAATASGSSLRATGADTSLSDRRNSCSQASAARRKLFGRGSRGRGKLCSSNGAMWPVSAWRMGRSRIRLRAVRRAWQHIEPALRGSPDRGQRAISSAGAGCCLSLSTSSQFPCCMPKQRPICLAQLF